jgi:uncharacterized protein YfaS (alpha-2-macroglobulin family)
MQKANRVIIVVGMLLLIVACSGPLGCMQREFPDVPIDTAAAAEPLAPQVVAQRPFSGEEMPVDGHIDVYFDQPMDQASVEAALSLSPSVPFTTTWIDDSTIRITPSEPLQRAERYTVQIAATAASAEGLPLVEAISFRVQTVGFLEVTEVVPTESAEEVEADSPITVFFNRPVVPLGVRPDADTIPHPLSFEPDIPGEGEWLNTSIYMWHPSRPMLGGQDYTVTVGAGLEDQTGGVLTEDFTWAFTISRPAIAELSPAADTTQVALDEDVRITFTQPMDRATTEAAFSITAGGQAARGSVSWEDDDRVLVFSPAGLLPIGSVFNVEVDGSALSAGGGAPLDRAYNWTFQTVPFPAVRSTDPSNGNDYVYPGNGISITFTAPMDESTIEPELLEVSPPLPEDAEVYYSTYSDSLTTYAMLEPSTDYTVTLLPGAADPYGNTIAEPYTFTFRTAPLEPMVQLNTPGTVGLYSAYSRTQLFALYRNVSRIDFSVYAITLDEFVNLSTNYDALNGYAPRPDAQVFGQQVQSEADLNVATYAYVPITNASGGSLDPGVYLLIADAPEVMGDVRHLMIVANANLTFKYSNGSGMVWLTDMQSGQPVADAPVAFYDPGMNTLGQAATNADGVAQTDLPTTEDYWETRYAVVQGDGLFAIASNNWTNGIDTWAFGVYGTLYEEDYTVYLHTDRPLYRPGQDVNFRGILRNKDGVDYTLPSAGTAVHVRITNSVGDIVYEQNLTVDEFGAFNDTLTLDEEASLGYYNIEVQLGDFWSSLGFQVAEYRKPEFQVTLTPEAEEVIVGDTIRATVDAQFYFGGAVSDAEVSWTVMSGMYYLDYSGPGNYSFSDYNWDVYESDYIPGYGRVIAEGTGTTDARGQFVIEVPASLEDSPGSRIFTIEAIVTDIDDRSVAGRTEVVVHRGEVYPGIQPVNFIGEAGESQDVSLIAVDWDGEPVANQTVTVTVVERDWYSVREEDEFGHVVWTWEVEETPVGTAQTVRTDAEGRATASFTPPNGGTFKVIATITDSRGNAVTSSAFMWISGDEFVSWRQANNNRIELIPDRTEYVPGDTAEILIASPFQGEVQALVTIERDDVISYEVITLDTNSYVYRLPITDELAPNVYVSVVIVKGVDETNPTPAFRMGLVELEIEPSAYELDVTVTPDREQVGPREDVTYTIEVRDREGDPVEAEVSLALADLAALSLASPNSGPILEHFYGNQPLGVVTGVSLTNSVDQLTQELLDQGKGGGGGGAEGFFEIRGDFRDTAFWRANVTTDARGRAEVTVTLPDNLTTWRMDARAVTQDTLVGQTEVDIVESIPLMIRPLTPRFFVVGDELAVGAVVNNNTDETISATVGLEAEGVEMRSDATQQVSIPAGGRADIYWDIVVENVEWVDMVFTVEGGGLTDASRPTLGDPDHEQQLPVYRWEVPETVGTAGQLTEAGQRVEGIVLPPTYDITQGDLTVEVDPSLAAGMVDGLDWLEHYPYECTEQTVSRFLPNALTLRAYRELGLEDPELEQNLLRVVNEGLQRLYSQQRVDGGWGWWVTSVHTNPTVTAYVILGFTAAREADILVEQSRIDNGIAYLNQYLESDPPLEEQAFILYVLARAGQPNVSRTVQLYDERAQMAHFSRAWLAQALWMIDESDSRAQELMNSLQNTAILSATGAHWEEEDDYRWIWNTDTRSTAIILDTYALLNPESDLVPNIVRWLMVARRGGHWETTQETAWALIAFTDWLRVTGELDADYDFIVEFNGETVAGGTASAETLREPTRLVIDVGEMLRDEVNRLTFARDEGPGRMYYTAHLTAYLPVEEVGALSRGIIVSRQYLDADGEPVTEARVGDILTARVTIIAPHDLYYVVVEDPIPAGSEAVNRGLLTESVLSESPTLVRPDQSEYGWGWWWFSRTEMRDEKTVLFADYLAAGTYEYTYQLRVLLPGEYRVIPPYAYEFYFPEVSGHGEGSLFTITEAD